MIIRCEFCKHFLPTGRDANGIPYELGGSCKKLNEAYCNGGMNACDLFLCDIECAKKIENYVNMVVRNEKP